MPVAKKRVKANSMAPLVRKKCTKTIRESPKPFCSYTMESLLFKWQSNEVWGNVHIIASHIKVSYLSSQDSYTETVMVKINMDCQNIKLNATKQAPQTSLYRFDCILIYTCIVIDLNFVAHLGPYKIS